MDFYDRINLLLKEQKSSKTKMSDALNIPYNTISCWFKRRSNKVDLEVIKKIASYLNTTPEYLATGNEKFKNKDTAPANTITITTKDYESYVFKLSDENLNAILTIIKNME